MFNKEQSVGIGWGAKVKKTMMKCLGLQIHNGVEQGLNLINQNRCKDDQNRCKDDGLKRIENTKNFDKKRTGFSC